MHLLSPRISAIPRNTSWSFHRGKVAVSAILREASTKTAQRSVDHLAREISQRGLLAGQPISACPWPAARQCLRPPAVTGFQTGSGQTVSFYKRATNTIHVATCCYILPHFAMKVYPEKLRRFCDDPLFPDPVWKLSTLGMAVGANGRVAASSELLNQLDLPVLSEAAQCKGTGRRSVGSSCERLLCFGTVPFRPMPFLAHFRIYEI